LLNRLQTKVRSGDPENIEAQAARAYWSLLLGKEFRRNRNGKSPNDLLNYGYTIVRSSLARAVVGTGLHPSIGLCHRNRYNPFVLVDDLLEPFRPFVDLKVKSLYTLKRPLDKATKCELVELLHLTCSGENGASSLIKHMQNLARSVASSYVEEKAELILPNPTDIELQPLLSA